MKTPFVMEAVVESPELIKLIYLPLEMEKLMKIRVNMGMHHELIYLCEAVTILLQNRKYQLPGL